MTFEAPRGARLRSARFDWDGRRAVSDWTIGLVGGDGRLIAGCRGGLRSTPASCLLGDPKGARRVSRGLGGRRSIRIEASCGLSGGCETGSVRSGGDRTRAWLAVHDPVVVVADGSAPNMTLGGSLLGRRWQRGRREATIAARDNVGIRSTTLRIDGRLRDTDRSHCDFAQRVPCPASIRRGHRVRTRRLADGRHVVSLGATDSAGNARRSERTIRVDNHAPRAVRRVRLAGGAGVRSRNSFDLRWTPPPGQAAPIVRARYKLCRMGANHRCVEGSRAGAVRGIDGLRIPGRGRWRFRVWLQDQAGNANRRTASAPVTLSFDPRSKTRMRARFAERGGRAGMRATVGFGSRPTVEGSLSTVSGRAVGDAPIAVVARVRGSDPTRRIGTTRTNRAGRFRYRLPAGPSRAFRLEYGGGGRHRPSHARVRLAVRAKSSIAVDRRRVPSGGRVRFQGRLLGRAVPASGKLLQLEAFYRDRWRTFEVLRTDGRGRWRQRYRFEATSGPITYPFRARIPRERGYPYAVGHSPVVRVTVDGG